MRTDSPGAYAAPHGQIVFQSAPPRSRWVEALPLAAASPFCCCSHGAVADAGARARAAEAAAAAERAHEMEETCPARRDTRRDHRPGADHGGCDDIAPERPRARHGRAARRLRTASGRTSRSRHQKSSSNSVSAWRWSTRPGEPRRIVRPGDSATDTLSNKQAAAPSARDGWRPSSPMGCRAGYEFQHTLSNGGRRTASIRLPGDRRIMVVDAKFPLEGVSAFGRPRRGGAPAGAPRALMSARMSATSPSAKSFPARPRTWH